MVVDPSCQAPRIKKRGALMTAEETGGGSWRKRYVEVTNASVRNLEEHLALKQGTRFLHIYGAEGDANPTASFPISWQTECEAFASASDGPDSMRQLSSLSLPSPEAASFQIRSTDRSITFAANGVAERDSWIDAISAIVVVLRATHIRRVLLERGQRPDQGTVSAVSQEMELALEQQMAALLSAPGTGGAGGGHSVGSVPKVSARRVANRKEWRKPVVEPPTSPTPGTAAPASSAAKPVRAPPVPPPTSGQTPPVPRARPPPVPPAQAPPVPPARPPPVPPVKAPPVPPTQASPVPPTQAPPLPPVQVPSVPPTQALPVPPVRAPPVPPARALPSPPARKLPEGTSRAGHARHEESDDASAIPSQRRPQQGERPAPSPTPPLTAPSGRDGHKAKAPSREKGGAVDALERLSSEEHGVNFDSLLDELLASNESPLMRKGSQGNLRRRNRSEPDVHATPPPFRKGSSGSVGVLLATMEDDELEAELAKKHPPPFRKGSMGSVRSIAKSVVSASGSSPSGRPQPPPFQTRSAAPGHDREHSAGSALGGTSSHAPGTRPPPFRSPPQGARRRSESALGATAQPLPQGRRRQPPPFMKGESDERRSSEGMRNSSGARPPRFQGDPQESAVSIAGPAASNSGAPAAPATGLPPPFQRDSKRSGAVERVSDVADAKAEGARAGTGRGRPPSLGRLVDVRAEEMRGAEQGEGAAEARAAPPAEARHVDLSCGFLFRRSKGEQELRARFFSIEESIPEWLRERLARDAKSKTGPHGAGGSNGGVEGVEAYLAYFASASHAEPRDALLLSSDVEVHYPEKGESPFSWFGVEASAVSNRPIYPFRIEARGTSWCLAAATEGEREQWSRTIGGIAARSISFKDLQTLEDRKAHEEMKAALAKMHAAPTGRARRSARKAKKAARRGSNLSSVTEDRASEAGDLDVREEREVDVRSERQRPVSVAYDLGSTASMPAQQAMENLFEITGEEQEGRGSSSTSGDDLLSEEDHDRRRTSSMVITRTRSRRLKGATLESLIKMLTHETDMEFMDSKNLDAFLLSYKAYTSAMELENLLFQRFNYVVAHGEFIAALRCIKVLDAFVKKHSDDLWAEDPDLLENVLIFCASAGKAVSDNPLAIAVSRSLELLETATREAIEDTPDDSDMLRQQSRLFTAAHVEAGSSAKAPNPDAAPGTVAPKLFSLSEDLVSAHTKRSIAEQITIMEEFLFRRIEVSEITDQAWNKRDKETRAPHVRSMIAMSNRIVKWHALCVLRQESLNDRRDALRNLVKLGNHLLDIKNFNGVFEVVGALEHSSIFRLKKTWEGVTGKRESAAMYARLKEVTSTDRNREAYRMALIAEPGQPVLPFLGQILTDLTFLDQGNQNLLGTTASTADLLGDAELINFSKHQRFADIVTKVKAYQGIRYELHKIRSLLKTMWLAIGEADASTENSLYELSLKREPRQRD